MTRIMKTFSVLILTSTFHTRWFFNRIKESILLQYMLQALSGPPLMELVDKSEATKCSGQLIVQIKRKGKGNVREREEVINVSKLYKASEETISAWTMKVLVDLIMTSGLSSLPKSSNEGSVEGRKREWEIKSEVDAKRVANKIFKNARKPGSKYIDAEDLARFLTAEEVGSLMPLFEGAANTEKVDKSDFKNWVHQT